ncbi:cobyrinate a,c-diamide synthase [Deinococcus cellulosilyticus]|uniref:Cobyrinate a,c-diamide synthase n=1 Tax=Deinococcus cellulosilyticus (strain DSM 18568 / NBRC 106333 / KACC 11606 / 5516J-15) TaxID=1223518 RepID=A0A511MYC9_DEIC1|nr:cobyrinate a,c-diamide synthase [Deinococcus cellulosilyticus]GEM45573.1 cobyrinic acid a,c-diamide synthase [Deinococcus cellulosilyticus NBRC 106333 = KACC 11606]
MVAAAHSGAGKTTVSSLICAGLNAQGLRVQPFKLGPDYLDPTHLGHAARVKARNLDSYLLPPERLKQLFHAGAVQAEVSVLEGVMGLFDGKSPLSDEHSTADLARLLKCPVVLVLDASGTARTIAAIAQGLMQFAQDMDICGVILNRVGSERHAELCKMALSQQGIRCFGHLTRQPELHLPGRHLGLLGAQEHALSHEVLFQTCSTLDLEGLLEVARSALPLEVPPETTKPMGQVRLGIAQDEAFSFYYQDALDLLERLGATLVPFSPLRDPELPVCDGLLIGGGYPEVHAAKLSENQSMQESIRQFAAQGHPVVAECGGLMYLSEQVTTKEGQVFGMCGVVPYRTAMTGKLTLGYREVTFLQDTPLGLAGTQVRGHEFHHSSLTHEAFQPAYRTEHGPEGYACGNVLASYVHLHHAGFPALARHFVQALMEKSCVPMNR